MQPIVPTTVTKAVPLPAWPTDVWSALITGGKSCTYCILNEQESADARCKCGL